MNQQRDHIRSATTLSRAEIGVIRTLLYFDIFNYPLTKEEIITFHSEQEETIKILLALNTLETLKIIFKHDRFYSFYSKQDQVQRRKVGNELATKRLRLAQKIAQLISVFPFVRGVM